MGCIERRFSRGNVATEHKCSVLYAIQSDHRDFDEDEKRVVGTTDGVGRHQPMLFLTELHLKGEGMWKRKMTLRSRLEADARTPEQLRMVERFQSTLECDEEHDMVMDLEDVCQFIEVRKDNAKRTLTRHFEEGVNFEVFPAAEGNLLTSEEVSRGTRGPCGERIMMTPDTFKELCMLSNTVKGKEVRLYYIRMEKVMKVYLRDQVMMGESAVREHQRALEAAILKMEEQASEVVAREAEVAEKDAELRRIRTKVYEELPKLDHVYINKEAAELASDAHKIGKAIDAKKRESQFNTGSAQGSRMIYKRPTVNAKIVEDIVKVVQRRYHITSMGGVEHYNNRVEHSVDVIDIAATVVDTLASSYEYMTRTALLDKVVANLGTLSADGVFFGARRHIQDAAQPEQGVTAFVSSNMEYTGARGDCVTLTEMLIRYDQSSQSRGIAAGMPRLAFKRQLLDALGPCAAKLNGERNLWRGWRFLRRGQEDEDT